MFARDSKEPRCLSLLGLILACWGVFFPALSPAQSLDWQWVESAGGLGWEYCWDLACDADGNVFATGIYEGTADFGNLSVTGSSGYNCFVAKLDSAGNWLWVRSAQAVSSQGTGIASDPLGNCYVVGSFTPSVTFGDITLTGAGSGDIFVAKLDPAGNWLWATRLGGSGHDASHKGIGLDGAGNVYVCGSFENSVVIGPDTLNSVGGADIFIAKLDPTGNCLWARRAGGSFYDDRALDLALDPDGDCLLTGHFFGTADFGSQSLSASGISDIFAAKLDSAGNWLWATRAGGIDSDSAVSIAAGSDGSAWLTGYFRRTADFGPYSLFSANTREDIFAAKLDSAGNWLWARRAGCSTDHDGGQEIAVNSAGEAYLTGYFDDTADFGATILTSRGSPDVFFAQLDSAGNWLWARRSGGQQWDSAMGLTLCPDGGACVSGVFTGAATFAPFGLVSQGNWDLFIGRINAQTPASDWLADPPEAIWLGPPSPHPVRGAAAIDYIIKEGGRVWLGIYDLRGRLVHVLADRDLAPGNYRALWDARDDDGALLPSGIYFCRLRSGSAEATRRLILVK